MSQQSPRGGENSSANNQRRNVASPSLGDANAFNHLMKSLTNESEVNIIMESSSFANNNYLLFN